jgi:drug/metabolite transporter (DMT)-like permease
MPNLATPGASAATMRRGPSAAALALNLGIIYVIWGSTYFGIAIAIETMPPFLMASIRFAIAGLLLVAFDLWRHPEARRMPTRRQVVDTIIVGGLLLGIGNGFVTFGQQTVPSGIAAILIAMIPLWFAIFGWLYFREKLPRIVGLAIVIGFAGTALLVAPTGDGANSFDLLGIVILLLAPIGWAHGSIYSARKAKLPPSPLTASGLQMLAGAGVTFVEALVINEPSRFHPETFSTASILAVVYLVVFGSMVAFTTYAWLLRNAPLSLVSTYAYVNPVVAVALGTIFLAEPISLRTIIASGIILAAVAIIVTARARLGSSSSADTAASAEVRPSNAGAPKSPEPAPPVAGVRPTIPPRAPSG